MVPIKFLILDILIIHAQRDPDLVNNTYQTELRIGFDHIGLLGIFLCSCVVSTRYINVCIKLPANASH